VFLVLVHGAGGDRETGGDRLGGRTDGHQVEHDSLTGGERRILLRRSDTEADRCGEEPDVSVQSHEQGLQLGEQ